MKEKHRKLLEERIAFIEVRKGKKYMENFILNHADEFRDRLGKKYSKREVYLQKQVIYIYKAVTRRYKGILDYESRIRRGYRK